MSLLIVQICLALNVQILIQQILVIPEQNADIFIYGNVHVIRVACVEHHTLSIAFTVADAKPKPEWQVGRFSHGQSAPKPEKPPAYPIQESFSAGAAIKHQVATIADHNTPERRRQPEQRHTRGRDNKGDQ